MTEDTSGGLVGTLAGAQLEQEARLAEARANATDPERGWPWG